MLDEGVRPRRRYIRVERMHATSHSLGIVGDDLQRLDPVRPTVVTDTSGWTKLPCCKRLRSSFRRRSNTKSDSSAWNVGSPGIDHDESTAGFETARDPQSAHPPKT